MLLASAGNLLVIVPLALSGEVGWPSWTFGMLCAGVAGFGVFALRVRRAKFLLLRTSLLRNRLSTNGLLIAVTLFGLVAAFAVTLNLLTQLEFG